MLELADWAQLFGETQYATQLCRRVWYLMENRPKTGDSEFSEPKPLFVRLPPPVKENEHRNVGIVDLNLTISKRGRVIGRRTTYQHPRDVGREFTIRKAVKFARFRPAFSEGQPVRTTKFPVTHAYVVR